MENIILGIDPGSRITGYGIIATRGTEHHHIAHGTIETKTDITAERLRKIYEILSDVIRQYQPQQTAIEQIFMHKNAQSALKLGQARGVAMVAAAKGGLEVYEYSAKQIKSAVVGYGAASKAQIQHMISLLLKLKEQPVADAADALAVAICHSNNHHITNKINAAIKSAAQTSRATRK